MTITRIFIALFALLPIVTTVHAQCSPDVTPPIITCPSDVTAACPHAVPSLTPTASDFCGPIVLQTYTLSGATTASSPTTGIHDASTENFLAGITTVTYYIEDAAGNSASCNFTVNVTDFTPPIVVCQGDIITTNDPGMCTSVVNMYALGVFPTAFDGCSGLSTVPTGVPPGSAFPVGTTTVTWVVTDAAGNFQTCLQNVTVIDNEDPTIVCPSNVTVNTDAGECYATVTIPPAVPADNCSVVSVVNDYNGGGANASGIYPLGTTTVTYTVTDSVNRTTTCSFEVTVVNSQSPIISLNGPSSITLEACSPYTEFGATATDNCLGDISGSIVIDASALDTSVVGTYNITYTVTNAAGFSTQIIRTVTIVDTTTPVLTLIGPNPMTIGDCSTYTELGALAIDPCFGDISGSIVIDNSSVDTSTLGTYTVTYNVTDASGNVASQIIRTITVVDVTTPLITLNGDNPQIIEACDAYNELGAIADDFCFGDISSSISIDSSSVDTSMVGSYNVTYNVTDASGNVALEEIRVVEVVDTTIPVITLNGDNPLLLEACSTYTEPGAIAIDPCFGDISGDIIIDSSTLDIGTAGSYTVTYNVTDASGNSAVEVIRVVTVTDTTAPTISCPGTISVSNDAGACFATIVYLTPVGSDNCPGSVTIQTAGLPSGSDFPIGTTTNTFEVTDTSGNTVSCSFDVVVNDTQAPIISCPADLNISTDVGQCTAIVNYVTPVGSDNCAASTTIQIAGLPSGSNFPIGTTINTFQVTDASGNTATCSFDVTVSDTESPIANCQDITLQLDPTTGTATITTADIDNGSSDNCNFSLSLSNSVFDCSSIGLNIVTLTVTDDTGNTSTCDATVTITDLSETASVSISTPDTTICQNESITFTAIAIDGGPSPSYQWQLNGFDISGETGDTYTTSTLTDGDIITVVMTSSLSVCAVPVTSNAITISINDYNAPADAGADITNTICIDTTITLSGNAITGSLSIGTWSVTSGQTGGYSFSDIHNPTSTFTGDIGETYTLMWHIDNPEPCVDTNDSITITFISCNALDFDGFDDNITFRDNYNLSGDFTIEVWFKSDVSNGAIQTILSKREATNLIDGYDLRLVNDVISFHWNAGESISAAPLTITTNRWYHVAVTYGSGTYTLYIDGVAVSSVAGSAPIANTVDCIAGAMDETLTPPFKPLNYFDGGLDELRIWDVALTEQQIRKMMNQEVASNSGVVRGSVVPLDIAGLDWTDLNGYYQMNQNTDLSGGNLISISTSAIDGLLRYMTTLQPETAPLPYQSVTHGIWTDSNTWLYGSSQAIPNSMGIDGTTSIDWNIVRSSHNVNSGDTDITVLGLEVTNNMLTIANTDPIDGQSIRITDYLKIDGADTVLKLVGESQLIQDMGSVVDYSGTGMLHRDQQGTTNLFNYNYWGSPVSTDGNSFTLSSILHDGLQPVLWTTAHNANPLTTPITMSSRWLYLYENYPINSYADWRAINENDPITVGLGFLMKGSGAAGTEQNYTFIGKPNNGSISTPITANYEALVGNPYPSAIDAHEFIIDNSGSILGTIYFWEHYTTNATHVTAAYQGGFAAYNLSGGNPAVSPPEISGLGIPSKIPERYIPIGQGFNVNGNGTGGSVLFENDQRVFVKEAASGGADTGSVFIRSIATTNRDTPLTQRIRIAFTAPDAAERPLLLAFVPNGLATDGYDYGYDAINTDVFPNDMCWDIEGEDYVIQGVGAFDDTKQYPLHAMLTTSGTISVSLRSLENFDTEVPVYLYDALLGTYTPIHNSDYVTYLEAGDYANRFYITFRSDGLLSIPDGILSGITVNYLNATDDIYIKTPNTTTVTEVHLINLLGQEVRRWELTQAPNTLRLPVYHLSEGHYIIKVVTDTGTTNKKVIVSY